MVRRHPLLALHGSYWALLLCLHWTAPSGAIWRSVVFGLALVYPWLLWRCSCLLLAGHTAACAGQTPLDLVAILSAAPTA